MEVGVANPEADQEDNSVSSEARLESLEFYGSSKSWKRRADRFRQRLRIQSYIGLAGPILVSGAYSIKDLLPKGWDPMTPTVVLVTICLILQGLVSAWSLVNKWDDELTYAEGSMKENLRYFKSWDELVKASLSGANIEPKMNRLRKEADLLEAEDEKRVSQDDRRFGMRAVLYKFVSVALRVTK